MNTLIFIAAIAFVAGITMFLGGCLARLLHFKNKSLQTRTLHFISAFGAGVLLSAVAFALIPKALHELSLGWTIFMFLFGTVFFIVFDILIEGLSIQLSQSIAMLLDFLPEALILGASFAIDTSFGTLLALFIALQNFPEGFNSYRELIKSYSKNKSLLILVLLSFLGVYAAIAGHIFLTSHPHIIGGIIMFASGGILYLMFQEIAPLAKQDGTWIPASGASLGFLLGMIIEKVV